MNLPTEKVPVLDHGFVQLIDVMGDDQAIVDAARVSIAGENTKPVSSNRALIRYLYRNRHTTPFEMVEFKFRCKMPIFVARQWIRHRTANVNEMSGRYSELPAEYYVPHENRLTKQSKTNKQASGLAPVEGAEWLVEEMEDWGRASFEDYAKYLEMGMAREVARINLPLSTYTEWIWKIDLHNLFHFLALRLSPHAQFEIRVYGEAMAKMVQKICPIAWEAFEDFRLQSMMLTAQDVEQLRGFIGQLIDLAGPEHGLDATTVHKTKRERQEYEQKLERLGVKII